MSFTKKHYDECARIVREGREHEGDSGLSQYEAGFLDAYREAGGRLSAMFAADNPRFDAARFAAACEPKVAK